MEVAVLVVAEATQAAPQERVIPHPQVPHKEATEALAHLVHTQVRPLAVVVAHQQLAIQARQVLRGMEAMELHQPLAVAASLTLAVAGAVHHQPQVQIKPAQAAQAAVAQGQKQIMAQEPQARPTPEAVVAGLAMGPQQILAALAAPVS